MVPSYKMGAAAGKPTSEAAAAIEEKAEQVDVARRVADIAAGYITRSRFKELERLSDTGYCNQLVVLTSKALSTQLDSIDIAEVDSAQEKGERVTYSTRHRLSDPELGLQGKQKRAACDRIAQYYVQIAHVFAAIQSAVRKTDSRGAPVDSPCAARLRALKPERDFPDMEIQPRRICALNWDQQDGTANRLTQEFRPGIDDLETLYKDTYSVPQGKWEMSPDMKKKYREDVDAFYTAFTGNSPSARVQRFSDIDLSLYRRRAERMKAEDLEKYSKDCKGVKGSDPEAEQACLNKPHCRWLLPTLDSPSGKCEIGENAGAYRGTYVGRRTESAFKRYGEHFRKMQENAEKSKNALNDVLSDLFVTYQRGAGVDDKITVNPELTREKLTKVIARTRSILTDLYLSCERDFKKGLGLLDDIIKLRGDDLQTRQLESVDRAEDELRSRPLGEEDRRQSRPDALKYDRYWRERSPEPGWPDADLEDRYYPGAGAFDRGMPDTLSLLEAQQAEKAERRREFLLERALQGDDWNRRWG